MNGIRSLAVGLILSAVSSCASENGGAPEVGSVDWERDYSSALAEVKKTDKPMFLFFQEVPG